MKHDADKQQRRSIRLPGYDYAQAGAYFVTIVTKDRMCLFGEIVDRKMLPNQFGPIVQSTWNDLPEHYPAVECDSFVVMPNHVHGIIELAHGGADGDSDVGSGLKPARGVAAGPNPLRAGFKPAPTLAEIIRAFKTFSARRTNGMRNTPGVPLWQRNYYEHIIRSDDELMRIREYIANNPPQWEMDQENPNRTAVKSIRKRESWEV